MKLLLTSADARNPTLIATIRELVGAPMPDCRIAVITTAATIDADDKSWFIRSLNRIKDLGFGFVDILDPSAVPESIWQPRLKAANAIFVTGGNPFHLLHAFRSCGLADQLPELLESRVYIGSSAGSAICGQSLAFSSPKPYAPDGMKPGTNIPALSLVPFCIRSHLDNPLHPSASEDKFRKQAKEHRLPVYAIDDQTALKVVDGRAEIVGEGKHLALNLPH